MKFNGISRIRCFFIHAVTCVIFLSCGYNTSGQKSDTRVSRSSNGSLQKQVVAEIKKFEDIEISAFNLKDSLSGPIKNWWCEKTKCNSGCDFLWSICCERKKTVSGCQIGQHFGYQTREIPNDYQPSLKSDEEKQKDKENALMRRQQALAQQTKYRERYERQSAYLDKLQLKIEFLLDEKNKDWDGNCRTVRLLITKKMADEGLTTSDDQEAAATQNRFIEEFDIQFNYWVQKDLSPQMAFKRKLFDKLMLTLIKLQSSSKRQIRVWAYATLGDLSLQMAKVFLGSPFPPSFCLDDELKQIYKSAMAKHGLAYIKTGLENYQKCKLESGSIKDHEKHNAHCTNMAEKLLPIQLQ